MLGTDAMICGESETGWLTFFAATRASDGKAIRLHTGYHSALAGPNSKAISEQRCELKCRVEAAHAVENSLAKRCSNDRPAVGSAYIRYLIDWPNGNLQLSCFPSCTWQPIIHKFCQTESRNPKELKSTELKKQRRITKDNARGQIPNYHKYHTERSKTSDANMTETV